MKRDSIFFTVLFLFAVSAFAQLPESLSVIFKYDRSAVPKYAIDSSFVKQDVVVERITYVSTDAFVVSAYITRKKADAQNQPLIIFNHWGEGDKNEFLEEAIAFSSKGFLCILVDGPWLCPDSPIKSFKRQGYEMYRQYVMNVRKAIDLAQQQFRVNPDQIYCVGHSFGCNTAAVLSAIEKRIDFFVFMAGVVSTTENISNSKFPDFVEWRQSEPQQFKDWVEKMKPLDAKNFLPYKTAPCLIQLANNDEYITREENERFANVTPSPKEVRKYDAIHALDKKAEKDREIAILIHSGKN